MLVVIANDLPSAVRGRMKLWFIEPRPNVFVSGVKDSVAKKVVEYLYNHCQPQSGLMIFRRIVELHLIYYFALDGTLRTFLKV